MAKIKLTKTELKAQRDALKQFTRFLPTLQLKKQQLQMEMRDCKDRIDENERREKALIEDLSSWLGLFGDEKCIEHVSSLISVDNVNTDRQNIAGVDVPVFISVDFTVQGYDLFSEDLWLDSAVNAVKQVIEVKSEHEILEEQYKLIAQELRTTTQRVNLFEKVKIPECKENIRTIQIYLGDQQTAAVGRSKIAKNKMQEVAS